MLVLQVLVLLFFMVAVPVAMGAGIASYVEKQEKNICFIWMTGFVLFMALFQVLAVPIILLQKKGDYRYPGAFSMLVLLFGILSIAAGISGILIWWMRVGKKTRLQVVQPKMGKAEMALWLVFGAGLVLQLVMAAVLSFSDGDDAYYVAVATVAENSDTMYMILPYTGATTGLDGRHALAPFPMLIAFLARVSGFHVATVAHVVMPLFIIPLTYCIYGLIGNRLFKGKKIYLASFMVFVEILVLWGNHSPYTAETFLMIRSWQGKAVLANVIIPGAFLVLYMIGERLAENRKVEKSLWVLLFLLMESASLCSTQGCVLIATLLGCFGLCIVLVYKAYRSILPIVLCLIPAVVYMGMYLWIQ